MTFMGKHKEFLRGDGTVLYPNCGVSAMGSTHVVQLHRTTHTHTHTHKCTQRVHLKTDEI